MKSKLFTFLLFLLCTAQAFAQDLVYFRNGDTANVRIAEVTPDLVKYRLYGNENGALISVNKSELVKIYFENGAVMNFNPAGDTTFISYKNVLKVGFFAPLYNYFSLTYEHALKSGTSVEVTLGYIGINTAKGYDYGKPRDVKGGLARVGWKYIFPGRYSRSDKDNVLHGFYFRPDFLIGYYRQKVTYMYYQWSTGGPVTETKKENVLYASLLMNVGKQWVIKDRFCLDIFGGAGYNFSSASDANYSPTGGWYENYKGYDFGVYSVWASPFSVTGGVRLGLTL